jgi:predicted Ser/Thr protein kinase
VPSGICPTSERRRSKKRTLSAEARFLRIWAVRDFWPVLYGHCEGFDGKISWNELLHGLAVIR